MIFKATLIFGKFFQKMSGEFVFVNRRNIRKQPSKHGNASSREHAHSVQNELFLASFKVQW